MESMASKTFCVRIVTLFSLLMVVISFVIESLSRAVVNSLSKELISYTVYVPDIVLNNISLSLSKRNHNES